MNDVAILVMIIDHFKQEPLISLLQPAGGELVCPSLQELSEFEGAIVTHDASSLLQVLTVAGLSPPKNLIDILEAMKLRSQVARDQGGERQWNVWKSAAPHFLNPADAKSLDSILQAKAAPPAPDQLSQLGKNAVKALASLWDEVVLDLKDLGELARFCELEVPVQQIFHLRRAGGLGIQRHSLLSFIRACENEHYSLFRAISSILGRSPQGISERRLVNLLIAPVPELNEDARGDYSIDDVLHVSSFGSKSAGMLLDYIRSKRDLSVLRELAFGEGRVFPYFSVQGTVTSRILCTDPRLQQLRKRYRAVVTADEGLELSYLDYAQFEPGILAVLSGDEGLLNAYRQGDIYAALAQAAFNDPLSRDLAKRIFLAHLYGMSQDRIAGLLAGADVAGGAQSAAQKVAHFFQSFGGIEKFRSAAQAELRDTGKVASVWGNARRRLGAGELTSKELRWAMNHKVQATASLVFKTSIVAIAKEFGANSLLLPMHDAMLLQFDPAHIDRENFEARCIEVMKTSFAKYCQGLEPRVIASSFAPQLAEMA
jgi:hypothetical protein